MKKTFLTSFLMIVLSWVFLAALVFPARAQTPSATPAPTSSPTSAPVPTAAASLDENTVTFTQLKQADIQLNGPYSSDTIGFAIPADWALKPVAQLELLFGVSFNTAQQQTNAIVIGGGTLSVYLNTTLLGVVQLNQVGNFDQKISIPPAAFTTTRTNGLMYLEFVLDAGESCRIIGAQTIVTIHPTSYLTLPHDRIATSTSLVDFPRPIFQNSFIQDSALLVIPDQPSPAELQAALTVAAGLGNLSRGKLPLDMTTYSKLASLLSASATVSSSNLIFIGKASSLPVLGQFALPLASSNGQFKIEGGGTDDGVVEMIGSPWNAANAVLVISANTDAGVVKSAQAVSTGVLRPNRVDNLAIVEQVSASPVSSPQAVDRTLTDLGYPGGTVFQTRGSGGDEYIFNVPVGETAGPDAYFELQFGNSALLAYNLSQIVVVLNDQPIGSLRMSDATAGVPVNQARIMIPAAAVVPGRNRLDVQVNLLPLDNCTPPGLQGLWIHIWPESTLHLPLVASTASPVALQDLANYPKAFIADPELSTTAFVLEHNDLESWRSAVKLSADLGFQASGSVAQLSAFYGDGVSAADRAKFNLLVLGRARQMPIVADMNNSLPAPFAGGSDVAKESNFQVSFRIPPDSPMGYVETMLSPWNSENVVLAVLGNTTQGVNWAATSLIEPTLRSNLGGNFAVVNDHQIITTNANLAAGTTGQNSAQGANPATGTSNTGPATDIQTQRALSIPLLVISILLILLIIGIVLYRSWLRNRQRTPPKAN